MKRTLTLILGLALGLPVLPQAEPAPWFKWRSKADGSLACSQTPLGHGWEKSDGPYRDARCEKRKPVK